MNKLLINEGGQPLYLDDLDFMQSAFAETVKGAISTINTYGNAILSGCEVSISVSGVSTIYSWDKGYVAIDGEVFQVEKGSFSGENGATLYWKVIITDAQKEIFENSSEHNVYRYRKVILTDTVEEGDRCVLKQELKTVDELTSKMRILKIKEASMDSEGKKGTLKLYDADISVIEDGDIVELLVTIGLETGITGGYTPSTESFKYIIGSFDRFTAKPFVWIKNNNAYEVVVVYVDFNKNEGTFFIVNTSNGKLHFSPISSQQVIVYKNHKK